MRFSRRKKTWTIAAASRGQKSTTAIQIAERHALRFGARSSQGIQRELPNVCSSLRDTNSVECVDASGAAHAASRIAKAAVQRGCWAADSKSGAIVVHARVKQARARSREWTYEKFMRLLNRSRLS